MVAGIVLKKRSHCPKLFYTTKKISNSNTLLLLSRNNQRLLAEELLPKEGIKTCWLSKGYLLDFKPPFV
jgi:hypothetical protein